jgi:ubiquinone/menaquinone biosynthesis C-methylase UbiE
LSADRFSGRADVYAKHRPAYPDEVVRILEKRAGWTRTAVVADIGAGTGISSELFLRHGNTVTGVEPNAEMRAQADALARRYPQFKMLDGTAENTGLPDHQFDFVVAATAFHWFDAEKCRTEFRRLLRPHGVVVLLWNLYQSPATPIVQAFEELTRRYLARGRHRWGRERHTISNSAAKLFPDRYQKRYLANPQELDFEGLKGRLLSTACFPEANDAMLAELEDHFHKHEKSGRVELAYQTALYFGELPLATD